MDKKTAWEHVLGEPVVSTPGERPMKAEITARFDGTFAQFCAWVEETFKNAGDLRVVVTVGGLPNEVVAKTTQKTRLYSGAAKHLAAITALEPDRAEDLVGRALLVGFAHKIEMIRQLRADTTLGLKEAKDFVEWMQGNPVQLPRPEAINQF